jgi:outer membrane protein insertion porin family
VITHRGWIKAWIVRAAAGAAITLAGAAAIGQPLKPVEAKPKDPTASKSDQPTGQLASDASIEPYQSRPVREVRLIGLKETPEQLVNNQIRSRANSPLSTELIREDVQRLNRLGRFKEINARIEPYSDGSVTLIFDVVETPIIKDVQAVGNRQLSDADLSGVINLLKDTPVDEFQIGAAKASIERLYRDKGYYQASVTIDQKELDEHQILLFRISEGERVKVTDIRFEGNKSFAPKQLTPSIKTTVAGLFESGPLDNEVLDRDVADLVTFYKDRGYLDIRADRQITFAPNGKEAIVTFLLDEGRVYTLRSVKVAMMDDAGLPAKAKAPEVAPEPKVYSRDQIAGLMEIKAGDVYSADKIRRSMDILQNGYARLGYVDARVSRAELRDETQPEVDLLILVREGEQYLTGLVSISGNELTQKKVIMRELDTLRPGRPLDTSRKRVGERSVLESEDRLRDTRLFEPGSVKVTVQPEDPKAPGIRDVLVEVRETNTGSLGFGAGLSSDSGVIGSVRLTQRNFDWQDAPDSWGEFITGRAFRGGGQDFNIELAPGTEVQTYTISLTDPYIFDTEYSGGASAGYRTREYDEFDQNQVTTAVSVGRRFGERWAGNITARYNITDISNIQDGSAQDLYDVEGVSDLTGLGFKLTRTTVDTRFRPSRGSRVELSAEQVGVFGGDYNFTKLSAEHTVFLKIDEDFLGRKTILSLKTSISYIPQDVGDTPLYERYYAGGRAFRGFKYRTISPKGLAPDGSQTDDPVGGTFLFIFSPEIQKPLWQDILGGVVFMDVGTVDDTVGFNNYRLSMGVGLRLYIEALGPVPLAFDFGFPIVKRYLDEERVFSFSVDLPF